MSDEIKKGLLGIIVDETTISQVMPEINSLTYRGYTVQELCDKCCFEEVAYLVINGELPSKKQLKKFIKEERSNRKLSRQILKDIQKMPKKAHPMDVVRTAVSLMALEVKAFDVSLILYAEHSFNVSTFTARTITSSLSDIHGAIIGAIASLKGSLHGGANEEVMHMMDKIKKPENALKWINKALDNKDVVMGFGHRVYKSGDSRVPTMKNYFKKVAKINKDKTYQKIYDIVEKVMIDRKDIHPNLDYPTGPTYHLMGFDTDFFTPIFVIARITGWSAHIMEQHTANKLIRPLSKYKGKQHRRVMPLNYR
jgi:citrate synthase